MHSRATAIARTLLLVLLLALGGTPALSREPLDYTNADMWAVRPGKDAALSLAEVPVPSAPQPPVADAFFVYPTTFQSKTEWTLPIARQVDDPATLAVIQRQASILAMCCRVFAPWYRQASSRAFAQRKAGGDAAYASAYADVERAFDHFIATEPSDRPFVLVGHSQGALHVLTLLHRRIVGTPLADRLVAAFAIGLAVPDGERETLYSGLELCRRPEQTGCLVAWEAYVEGSDASSYIARSHEEFRSRGGTGKEAIACINPLSFDERIPTLGREANLGTLSEGKDAPELVARAAGARCEGGILYSDPAEALNLAPLPGGSLHFHDLALFYANIRANLALRIAEWMKTRTVPPITRPEPLEKP